MLAQGGGGAGYNLSQIEEHFFQGCPLFFLDTVTISWLWDELWWLKDEMSGMQEKLNTCKMKVQALTTKVGAGRTNSEVSAMNLWQNVCNGKLQFLRNIMND